jgi:hypothetical protein
MYFCVNLYIAVAASSVQDYVQIEFPSLFLHWAQKCPELATGTHTESD